MDEIFQVNSSSFQDFEVSASLRAGPGAVFDLTQAARLTGSGAGLTDLSASYIVPNSDTTASYATFAESASWAPDSLNDSASYLMPGASIFLSQSYIYSVEGAIQPPFSPATIWWDDNAKTYAIYTDHAGVALQIGQENWIRCVAGENIPDGSPVYVSGSANALPLMKLAIADGGGKKYAVVGVATETIASGSIGMVTSAGQCHDLNTSGFADGAGLFLSHLTSGSFVSYPPPDPYEKVICGYVLYSHATSGSIQVDIVGLPQFTYPYAGMVNIPSMSISNYTASIGTGSVNLCTTADGSGKVKNYQLQSASFILNDALGDVQYIVANYNGGSPIYQLVTDQSTIDSIQTALVYTISPAGGIGATIDYDTSGLLLANKLLRRVRTTEGIVRSSGLALSVSNSLYISITSGSAWNGPQEVSVPGFNSLTDRTILLAHSNSLWSASYTPTLEYINCDNGTNVVPLGGGHHVANWIYKSIDSLNTTYFTLGPDYNTLADCQASQPPTPPPELNAVALLIGRVIYKKADTVPKSIDSAFIQSFVPAGITTHNDLNNIQGGAAGEYYHLTSASYVNTIINGTSSWASQSFSASHALRADNADSASFATRTISASFAISAANADSASHSTYAASTNTAITTSWADNATSASFASRSITSSFALSSANADTSSYSTYAAQTNTNITTSWANSASWSENTTSASFATRTISSSFALSALNADTASYSTYAGATNTQITTSWSNNSTSASFATRTISSSHALIADDADSASFANYASTTNLNVTVSYSDFAKSASWAPMPVIPSADSASWASSSLSSSYAQTSSWSGQSITSSYAEFAKSSSWGQFAPSSSYGDFAKSASYALGTNLNVTVSYANFAQSSSWGQFASSSSYSDFARSSSYAQSASWSPGGTSVSSSYAEFAKSSSWGQFALSSSYGDFSKSSSYAQTASWSVTSSFFVTVTSASWASSSLSSSYAETASFLTRNRTYEITSSWAVSASYVPSTIVKGGTLYNSAGITLGSAQNIIIWRAPYPCTVVSVGGYRVGGTSATVNARKNGSLDHLTASLTIGTADTWDVATAVSNSVYTTGDKMELTFASAAGKPTQIAIQVNLTK